MKHGLLVAAVIVVVGLVATSPAVNAQADSIGLGIAAGVAFPAGSTPDISSTDWRGSFNWGLCVNIPLIYTFYLTPTAELYKFGDQNATDMAIAFKYIVPLSRFDLYARVVPGLTAVGDVAAAHVGLRPAPRFSW